MAARNVTIQNCYIHGWSIQLAAERQRSIFQPEGSPSTMDRRRAPVQNCVLDGSPESNSGVGIYGGASIHGNVIENVPTELWSPIRQLLSCENQVFDVPYSVDPVENSTAIFAFSSGSN